ncbi:MAG: hypothetical protein KBA87_07245 [Lachnospiraceae bacterium]|jgi:hypothetical protein|nr:hypothetical protein [Lachnospiraceae bacterium]
MSLFGEVREKLKGFVAKHDIALSHVWHGILCLIGQIAIIQSFPDQNPLNNALNVAILTVVGAFVPISATVIILIFVALIHLAALSGEVALVAVLLLFIGYLISSYYQADTKYNLVLLPVFYKFGIPFAVPMAAGLTGSLKDVTTVIFGSFEAYFFRLVVDNRAALSDPDGSTTAVSLIMEHMLKNRIFYCFLVAQIVMFLVVYIIRTRNTEHSWAVGVGFGSVASFAVMIVGNLFFHSNDNVLSLMLGMVITVVLGLAMSFAFVDLDYSRPENVQFEDDDYYYYVTAIPKAKLQEEKRTVTHITGRKPHRKENE